MEFQQRLEKAIERGQRIGAARMQAEAEKAMSEKELARLHSQYRLALSEHIENCLRQLADHFPGFRFETILDERGWGASIRRDDLHLRPGARRGNAFSRLEMVVSPPSPHHVLELAAKATIVNKEVFRRSQYQRLAEADLDSFHHLVDQWALEYAEIFAAKR